jgi:hypothetical protein
LRQHGVELKPMRFVARNDDEDLDWFRRGELDSLIAPERLQRFRVVFGVRYTVAMDVCMVRTECDLLRIIYQRLGWRSSDNATMERDGRSQRAGFKALVKAVVAHSSKASVSKRAKGLTSIRCNHRTKKRSGSNSGRLSR